MFAVFGSVIEACNVFFMNKLLVQRAALWNIEEKLPMCTHHITEKI